MGCGNGQRLGHFGRWAGSCSFTEAAGVRRPECDTDDLQRAPHPRTLAWDVQLCHRTPVTSVISCPSKTQTSPGLNSLALENDSPELPPGGPLPHWSQGEWSLPRSNRHAVASSPAPGLSAGRFLLGAGPGPSSSLRQHPTALHGVLANR